MAPKPLNPLLPTEAQCDALTDAQCMRMLDIMDPTGKRPNKNWEVTHQPALIRLYMKRSSWYDIDSKMARILDSPLTYKSYGNRMADWGFPRSKEARDSMIIKMYAAVTNGDSISTSTPTPLPTSAPARPTPPRQIQSQARMTLHQRLATFAHGLRHTHERGGRGARRKVIEFDEESISGLSALRNDSSSHRVEQQNGWGTINPKSEFEQKPISNTGTPSNNQPYEPDTRNGMDLTTESDQGLMSTTGATAKDHPYEQTSNNVSSVTTPYAYDQSFIANDQTLTPDQQYEQNGSEMRSAPNEMESDRMSISTIRPQHSLDQNGASMGNVSNEYYQHPLAGSEFFSAAEAYNQREMIVDDVSHGYDQNYNPSDRLYQSSEMKVEAVQDIDHNSMVNMRAVSIDQSYEPNNMDAENPTHIFNRNNMATPSNVPTNQLYGPIQTNVGHEAPEFDHDSMDTMSTMPPRQSYEPNHMVGNATHEFDRNSIASMGTVSTNQSYELQMREPRGPFEFDRGSISTMETVSTNPTWISSSSASLFSDMASRRDSIATTNSSVSFASQYSFHPKPEPVLLPVPTPVLRHLRKPLKPPRHDAQKGEWNGSLRVVPCGQDHSGLDPRVPFEPCLGCGFTQWHALMVHARSMELGNLVEAMSKLRNVKKIDFAGNAPVHFLMIAGVEMNFFSELTKWNDKTHQNAFGQNPLHVLNPQDLEDQLVPFLESYQPLTRVQGLLLAQRDIYGRTPLHTLLQRPLPRTALPQIIQTFPLYMHQLSSRNTAGETTIEMMERTSRTLRNESESDYCKIQDGINVIRDMFAKYDGADMQEYGFNDIVRGARGMTMGGFFLCRICNSAAHTNSYADQMRCARAHHRDCNGPDHTGLTPAHALLLKKRSNDNHEEETAAQTEELFRILIPQDISLLETLREALHVLDPNGHNLVHNIAIKGLPTLLSYVLSLEPRKRRTRAMVNASSRRADGQERGVLEAVNERVRELTELNRIHRISTDPKNVLAIKDEARRLHECRLLLAEHGAVRFPKPMQSWTIVP